MHGDANHHIPKKAWLHPPMMKKTVDHVSSGQYSSDMNPTAPTWGHDILPVQSPISILNMLTAAREEMNNKSTSHNKNHDDNGNTMNKNNNTITITTVIIAIRGCTQQ